MKTVIYCCACCALYYCIQPSNEGVQKRTVRAMVKQRQRQNWRWWKRWLLDRGPMWLAVWWLFQLTRGPCDGPETTIRLL